MNQVLLVPHIDRYVDVLKSGNADEAYKWFALKTFQENWNIDAPDFSGMFEKCLPGSQNLWASNNYFPKLMITQFAELDAEGVRSMFRELFDEEIDLSDRIHSFIRQCDDFVQRLRAVQHLEKSISHYHKDVRAISFYLTFRYPEKYLAYKFTEARKFAQITGETPLSMAWDPAEKYLWFLKMATDVRSALEDRSDLIKIYETWLKKNQHADPRHTLLTMDFIIQTARSSDNPSVREQAVKYRAESAGASIDAIELPSKNVIYYGPPGTGKTFFLRDKLFSKFTEHREAQDEAERLAALAQKNSWWKLIAAALLDLKSATVPEIVSHRLVQAKNRISDQRNPKAMLWAMLQQHTVAECANVKYTHRVEPLIFSKDANSIWSVLPERVDADVPEIRDILKAADVTEPGQIDVKRYEFVTFHQSYAYEDFVEGIRPLIDSDAGESDASGNVSYIIRPGIFRTMCDRAAEDPDHDYALFIDEINRANVSQVFGELITLIEDDKRSRAANALSASLPYSRIQLSVPSNLYLVGTMNTADRSVEALDTALRRRFSFVEMQPDPSVVSANADGIDLGALLRVINGRIERLLDRDHRIGHAYLVDIPEDDPIDALRFAFAHKIIPLLTEYFYGEWEKVGLILGKPFVTRLKDETGFASFDSDNYDAFEERPTYRITDPSGWSKEDFLSIYEAS